MHIDESIKKILKPAYHFMKKGNIRGYVFMLHRVDEIDSSKLHANENMKISPGFLDSFINKYKDEYDFIGVDKISERIAQGKTKKFMAFTMDDGYKDNFTKALPIFEKYEIPFTIFLATDFPDYNAVLWWYVLEDYILSHDYVVMPDEKKIEARTKEEKENAFMLLRSVVLGMDQHNLKEEIEELLKTKLAWKEKCEELAMTWDEVIKCTKHPLVIVGGHTKHHYNLKGLESELQVREEIRSGCERLEEKTRIKAEYFAYPFGSPIEVGKREIEVVSAMNFKMAFLAGGGYCGSRYIDRYAIPRLMLTEDFKKEMLK